VKEYDVYVPVTYNDGSPIEPRKFVRLGGVTYRDEIVIFRVITDKVRSARRFLTQLKEELKRDLKQEEILIVEKDAELL
jgi:hypothetical protein